MVETIEGWEHQMLSMIFRVSLDKNTQVDHHGHALQQLPDLRRELEESQQEIRLTTTMLDQALLEAASHCNKSPLVYLLQSWKRVCRQCRALKRLGETDVKYQIVAEARRLCMSYCIFATTMPDMFE